MRFAPLLVVGMLLVPSCATVPVDTALSEEEIAQLDLARLQKAAEQGDAAAQFLLGLMYANGVGITEDDEEAVRWHRLAAEQGFDMAQLLLGSAYANGSGVPEDDAEAVRWVRLAAEQGYAQDRNGQGAGERTDWQRGFKRLIVPI